MKNNLSHLGMIAIFAVMFFSCDKIETSTPLTINWDGVDVTMSIPVISDTLPHSEFGTGSFTYNLDSLIRDKSSNVLNINSIDSIVVTSIKLTILNRDTNNNSGNFRRGYLAYMSNANTTPTTIGDIPENPNIDYDTIPCPIITRSILKSTFSSGAPTTITYIFGGKMRKPTTHPLDIKAHVTYTLYGIMKA